MKKIISFLFATFMVFCVMSITVFADECQHEFLAMRNMVSHYEECQKCFELRNAGNHTFENGKCTVCGYDEPVNPFADVANDAWYAEDLITAVSTGLISGKTTDKYVPNDNLTYAEAVKLAACMNEKYTKGEVTLKVGDPWYQTYVDYCKENNIIRADYNWSDLATRVGYMYIFACALPDEAYEPINTIEDGMIPDIPMDSPYAAIVYKMYRAGIVTGVDAQHNCNPTANITRAEVAVIVARMMDSSKRVKFEMKKTGEKENGEPEYYDNISTITDTEVKVPVSDASDVVVTPTVPYDPNHSGDYIVDETKEPLEICNNPTDYEAKNYGEAAELKVVTDGGMPTLSYEWHYYTGYRNETAKAENGEFVSGADTDTLTVKIEEGNTLLGCKFFCKVKDASGAEVTSKTATVTGPLRLELESMGSGDVMGISVVTVVSEGILREGDRIEFIRGEEVLCDGYAEKLTMFNKTVEAAKKGETVGFTFASSYGDLVKEFLKAGDIGIRYYREADIVNPEDVVN